MQSAVDRILNGNFNKENHSLEFSPSVIEASVSEGSVYESSFMIYGPKEGVTSGIVSSTSLKIETLVESFSGSEVEIPFRVDSVGLSDKDEIKGEIRVISNRGEYQIPFNITIGAVLDTSLGDIKNLFHFTNLARTNWQEAVDLFVSDNFEKILTGSDSKYVGIYRALRSGDNKDQCLEEFLLAINKKQPAELIAEDPNIRIEGGNAENERYIIINRNGWGYSEALLESECEFIKLEKTTLTNEDFDSNEARVIYRVRTSELHDGKNFGRIRVRNAYNDFYINVCVTRNAHNRKVTELARATGHLTIDLMHYYEAFRCKKISAGTWITNTGSIIDQLMELAPDELSYILFHVQLLITQDRVNEAAWILEQNEDKVLDSQDVTLCCYYSYLSSLIDRSEDHVNDVADEVENAYKRNKDNWRIVWLLMYLSTEYSDSLPDRWELIKSQFSYGCTSPVLYTEAVGILWSNPTVMSSLSAFELQVLRYMARNEILNDEIIHQFMYLLNNVKNYDKNMFGLLKACYKVNPSDDVLKSICSLLINIGRTDKEAFEWYAKAVDEKLRITKLYEYYMMSLDMQADIEIPKIVLMYFALDSSLDSYRNSYLYAYVYRKKTEYPELYDSYRENLERFVMFRLLAGECNEYLAYLYKNILTQNRVTPEIAKGLSRAVFVHMIVPKREDIRRIFVQYTNLEGVEIYKYTGDRAYIPIFGDNYKIVLEDENGNMFVRQEEYENTRLLRPESLAQYMNGLVEDSIYFDLYRCENGDEIHTITRENVDSMQRIADSDKVSDSIRKEIRSKLFKFYYDEDMMNELDTILNDVEIEDVPGSAVTEIIQYMVLRGMYEKAYRWVCFCGGENIDVKVIVRLCSRLLLSEDFNKDEEDLTMTTLIFRAFQFGKSEENLLKYLVKYFRGTSKEMKDVWKTCRDRGVIRDALEPRILEQMLYTNAYVPGIKDIFLSYSGQYTYNRLAMAFLSQVCYDFFVCEKITDDIYFEELQRYIDSEQEIPLICKLAYAKFYSSKVNEIDEKITRTLVVFLKDIANRGMYFGFFKDYSKTITSMHRFLDKTMVEYRAKEGSKAVIHYMIENNMEEQTDYVKEQMHEMYHGIFVKQFVLFFGERLQYYIVEQNGENETVTESGTISNNDMEQTESESRYSMINDIAISRTLGDYGTMDELLLEYFRKEYLLGNLFNVDD